MAVKSQLAPGDEQELLGNVGQMCSADHDYSLGGKNWAFVPRDELQEDAISNPLTRTLT